MCSPRPRHCISQTPLDCYHAHAATLNAPVMVTDSISGTMKMFGRKLKSDPVSNYLFNKLDRDGLINYEVVIAFRGGPCFAVAVDTVNDPDCPGLGDSTNLETSHSSLNS